MHIHLTNYFASFFRRATSLAYARLVVFPTQHSVRQIADRVSWAGPFAQIFFVIFDFFFNLCSFFGFPFPFSLIYFLSYKHNFEIYLECTMNII